MILNKASGLAMSLKGKATADGIKISIENPDPISDFSHWKLTVVKPVLPKVQVFISKGYLRIGDTAKVSVTNATTVTLTPPAMKTWSLSIRTAM